MPGVRDYQAFFGPAALCAVPLLLGTGEMLRAQPQEIMLRDAARYPDSSYTQGRAAMPARSSDEETSYHVSAFHLILDDPTIITQLAGVGYEYFGKVFDWDAIVWTLNVWQASDDYSARQLFEQSPRYGNFITQHPLSAVVEPYNDADFYLVWTPSEPLEIRAGEYLVSVRGFTTNSAGTWYFRETAIDLGSDYYAAWTLPGVSFEYTTDMGWPTGSEALDIKGVPIRCLGDLNFDGVIDQADLSLLLANYGQSPVSYQKGDLNLDGFVDQLDLSLLLSVYGKHCDEE